MLSDLDVERIGGGAVAGLNAPYGARCFLTSSRGGDECGADRLNAPYGARCFLTSIMRRLDDENRSSLNAPYGARCFLTRPQLP